MMSRVPHISVMSPVTTGLVGHMAWNIDVPNGLYNWTVFICVTTEKEFTYVFLHDHYFIVVLKSLENPSEFSIFLHQLT